MALLWSESKRVALQKKRFLWRAALLWQELVEADGRVAGKVLCHAMHLSPVPEHSPGDSWSCAHQEEVTPCQREGRENKLLKGY